MDRDIQARNAQLRAIEVYKMRPKLAHACTNGTAEVRDGFGCNYIEGDYKQCIDMPVPIGGNGRSSDAWFLWTSRHQRMHCHRDQDDGHA